MAINATGQLTTKLTDPRRKRAVSGKKNMNKSKPSTVERGADSVQRHCSADVSDFTGYHFSKCGRPAKWLLNGQPRCGLHCSSKWKKANREPIQPNS